MSKSTIVGTDTVYAALVTRCNANFTELYNMLTGVAASTLLTPTIASFVNATHDHADDAGGGATITVEAWTDVSSFGSGWSTAGGLTVSYMKDQMGFVHLKGACSHSSSASYVPFTLPAGYRPEQAVYFASQYNTSGGAITVFYIGTNGEVSTVVDSCTLYLDGVTFKAA